MNEIFLLQAFVLITLISRYNSFELPQNLEEKVYIEQLFEQSPTKNGSVDFASIGAKLRREYQVKMRQMLSATSEIERQQARRGADLIYQYISLAHPKKMKCDIEKISEFALLIKFHSEAKPILNYMRFQASKQFSLCRLDWDHEFIVLIKSLDDGMVESLYWLVNGLMPRRILANGKKIKPKEPYSKEDLTSMVLQPRVEGIVEYMIKMADLKVKTVKGSFKCSKLKWQEFLMATEYSLMPLCRHLCQLIEPATTIYKVAFDPSLNIEFEPHKDKNVEMITFEWLAYIKLACNIVDARDGPQKDESDNILRRAYNLIKV